MGLVLGTALPSIAKLDIPVICEALQCLRGVWSGDSLSPVFALRSLPSAALCQGKGHL